LYCHVQSSQKNAKERRPNTAARVIERAEAPDPTGTYQATDERSILREAESVVAVTARYKFLVAQSGSA